MAEYLLGMDVGTSSLKAVLMEPDGAVVATATPEYPFQTPRPLWAESDPLDWWQACLSAIREILEKSAVPAREIVGIGLSGQMHGLVMLDALGNVLRPCIMWNDQRTAQQCQRLTMKVGSKKVLELTGNPILPGFTAPKIVWVNAHEPEVFAQCDKFLLPKDYVRYRLSNEFYTDVSDASGTSLLNVGKRDWEPELLEACGIHLEQLPTVTESVEASTKLSREAAELTGLLEGTPIVAGGGDQAAQAVGCGIVREGLVSCTLGTSGVVFAHSSQYRVEENGRLHAFCSAVPGEWHLMGVMLSAAGSYQWYRDHLAQEEVRRQKETGTDAYAFLDELATQAPAGSEGLLFLPYLSGERTPHPDPNARGVFFGMSLRHSRAHLTRAVLEGVTYGLRDSLELMRELGVRPSKVIASGGGARSPFWRHLLANIFQVDIATVNVTEGAAYGACLLAGVGADVYPSVQEACKRTISESPASTPEGDALIYEDYYKHYRALYPLLKDEFQRLAKTVDKHLSE
ncbi:MAG: xylulokinase [Opitutales bacterium]